MSLLNSFKSIRGTLRVPGDKSISHRAAIFASLVKGETTIHRFLQAEDCLRTLEAFEAFGVRTEIGEDHVKIKSDGMGSFNQPNRPIDLGNSGTTARLLSGVLAALPFRVDLIGDQSLSKRPMKRVTIPLEEMGANVHYYKTNGHLPMQIEGSKLQDMTYTMPVASAQVKSALLLAGLTGEVDVTVIEKAVSRDHTERMMEAYGIHLTKERQAITLKGKQQLMVKDTMIPGDFSSAAYWIAAALITPGSEVTIEDVGLNPTRTGLINVLKRMCATIHISEERTVNNEPIGTITARYSTLTSTTLMEEEVPTLIDEIPILALIATQADGTTRLEHIEELKWKETDRIQAIVQALEVLGAIVKQTEQGMEITGKQKLQGGDIQTFGDHRIAMMAQIASLITEDDVVLDDRTCVKVSYPDFFDDFSRLIGNDSSTV